MADIFIFNRKKHGKTRCALLGCAVMSSGKYCSEKHKRQADTQRAVERKKLLRQHNGDPFMAGL